MRQRDIGGSQRTPLQAMAPVLQQAVSQLTSWPCSGRTGISGGFPLFKVHPHITRSRWHRIGRAPCPLIRHWTLTPVPTLVPRSGNCPQRT